MEEKKVSIIIPIYKVENYLNKCIESVVNQTHKNLEVILVDDGSPDNCPKICDEWANKDKRIKVIHKKNSGVSAARNDGLKCSTGDYVMFVDGDDYVDNDYISYFIDLVKTNDNICIGFNTSFYSIFSPEQTTNINSYISSSETAIEKIYLDYINVAVWNKIYKRDYLINNNIFFDESIWYGEGMLFNIVALQYTDNVVIGNKKVYHQVYNLNSAMRSFNLNSNLCGIKSLDIQKSKWIKKNNNIINSWNFHRYCFNISILKGIIKTNQKRKYIKEYKECIRNIRKKPFVSFKININIKRKILFLLYAFFPVFFTKLSIRKEKNKYKKILGGSYE